MQNLSDVSIRAAKPPVTGRITFWDPTTKHFGVRITKSGTKSFIILLGSGRRITIGHYPTITLAQARDKAKRILAERTLGRHRTSSIGWQIAVEKFLDARRASDAKHATVREYERTLKRYFGLGTTKCSEITKLDISRRLEKLNQVPSQKAHALVVIKMLFRWLLQEGYIEIDPTASFKRAKQRKRKRTLTDAELKAVWEACSDAANELSENFRTIVKLLILCGQRRSETAAIQDSWIKDNTITLPSSITKNGREHTFPLCDPASSLLCTIPRSSGLLFPARSRKRLSPFNGWSKAKRALDQICPIAHWTLHDLRRTFRTIHGRIGTPPHIAERLVNHVDGVASDVEQTYDLYTYLPEMRKAMEAYQAEIIRLTADTGMKRAA